MAGPGSALAQDRNNTANFSNTAAYIGDVLSNTSIIRNNAPGTWAGDVVTNAGTVENNAGATWQGRVISNTLTVGNFGTWLDGEVIDNQFNIFNHVGATWHGDVLAIGGDAAMFNWGNWYGDIHDNLGTVYNDGVWTGDILDNHSDMVNGLDSNYQSLWVGDVLGNSSYILNYLSGRWEGDVVDNAGDIANYADWTGDLTNRGRIINFGVWTGNIVHTGTFFWAENQIIGNVDNRGWMQLYGDLDVSGLLTSSGRLQFTYDAGLQTLNTGSALFTPTSSYEIDVTALGGSDLTIVEGAASLGGTVLVKASTTGGGTFDEQKSYTILTAGSLTGTFAGVTTDLAYLSPHLSYDTNNVYLGLQRNDVGFAAIDTQGNQTAVGAAVEALDPTNPIYDAVLWLTPAEAQDAFDQLSGEAYGAAGNAAIQRAGLIEAVVLARLDGANAALGDSGEAVSGYAGGMPQQGSASGSGVWATAYGASMSKADGIAALDERTGGMVIGADGLLGDWRLGALLQLGATSTAVEALNTRIDSADYGAGFYAGTSWGATQLSLGGAYTLHDTDSSRSVDFSGFSDSLSASYKAHTAQVFAELSHEFELGPASLTPYLGLTQVRYASDSFVEEGGAAALGQAARVVDATFATLGLRIDRSFLVGDDMLLTARASLGWRHGSSSNPDSTSALAGAPAFVVSTASAARDLAVLSAGLSLDINATSTINLSYDGQLGGDSQTHALKASWAMQF